MSGTRFGARARESASTPVPKNPKPKKTQTEPLCQVCHTEEREWMFQPYGPGEGILFTFPGSHYRGFVAVAVCGACHDKIQRGERVSFVYKKQVYQFPE